MFLNKNNKNFVFNEGYSNKKNLFKSALGSKIFYKGSKYIDLSLGAGSLILGHNSSIYKYAIKNLTQIKPKGAGQLGSISSLGITHS